jgi:hypothetical protein
MIVRVMDLTTYAMGDDRNDVGDDKEHIFEV